MKRDRSKYDEKLKKKREQLKRDGLCIRCEEPNDRKDIHSKNGHTAAMCTACLESWNEHAREIRERAKAKVDDISRSLGLTAAQAEHLTRRERKK